MNTGQLSVAALAQHSLWGTDPDGWADVAEPLNLALLEAMLEATGVGPTTRLLDIGCGRHLVAETASVRSVTARPGRG